MEPTQLEPLRTLLEAMARSLVDTPSGVEVRVVEEDEKATFQLRASSGETGQLIGRDGRLGNALRTVLKSAAKKMRTKPVYLDINS